MIKCPTIKMLHRSGQLCPSSGELPEVPCRVLHVLFQDEPTGEHDQEKSFACLMNPWTHKLDLEMLLLTLEGVNLFPLADADPNVRTRALEQIEHSICRLSHLPVDVRFILPADPNSFETSTPSSYEDAFNAAFDSIHQCVRTAENHQITLLIENPSQHLFLSPLELRDFLDQINNPYIGVCFNPVHALALGDPFDWFGILGPRCLAVKIPSSHTPDEKKQSESFLQFIRRNQFGQPVILEDADFA